MNQQNEQYITSALAKIKRLSGILESEETSYNASVEAAREAFARRTSDTRNELDVARKQLMSTMKRQKKDIFPGDTDRIEVPGGVLIRHVSEVVRKARHITAKFLRYKARADAIRTEESVDWENIEKWSNDDLAVIGTERKKKETFAYELEG